MAHFYLKNHEARIDETIERVKYSIVLETVPLTAEVAVTPEPIPYDKRLSLKYRPIKQGEHWGNTWDCAWFHIKGVVPKEWKGSYITLNIGLQGEALLFDSDGCPLNGLTNGSVFESGYNKDHFHFIDSCKGGEKVDFWIDAGCNTLFGVPRKREPDWELNPERKNGFLSASVEKLNICRFDYDMWQLYNDLVILISLYKTFPNESGKRIRIVRSISKALDFLPPERGGAPAVRQYLKETAFAIGPDPASIKVSAIGHAHIDTAWLWPIRETVRKVARTWGNQIELIRRYPGYKFGASQAQLYKYCKENYPKLYAKVKKAVKNREWEVQGGMWVEADCNIPSGESLIRQFLAGSRFFIEEFGETPRNLWLPDVFGYSGNLPQIMKICGIDFFLTQKLSWNRYNTFPHNTFVWEGIDGSRVVTHFPPEDNYNSFLHPESLIKFETNNREAGIVNEAISLFGIGDGGGGPREEFVENGIRTHALNGCPQVNFSFAQDAFDRIAKLEDDLDIWSGELYFEMHRGTYTTQALQKLRNRRGEEALRVAEMLAAAADLGKYPADELRKLWEDLLLCQFHDIIPGSSIKRVYDECGEIVQNVIDKAKGIAQKAGVKLLRKNADSVTFFNPSSTPYTGSVALPEGWSGAELNGTALSSQAENGSVFVAIDVAPRSFATLVRSQAKAVSVKAKPVKSGNVVLENDLVRYEIDTSLRVVSALDKTNGREFITASAPGNFLSLYDDHPSCYDAWDIEEYAFEMQVAEPENIKLSLSTGPLRASIDATFTMGGSDFKQTIRLENGSKRLDFETSVEWREKHKLCRVAFPVAVRAENATFEIQYGTVNRATHDNTKWQYAQFESCGHRYADLSDAEFGVALLNDSKYGYRVKGSVLSISLLRAPTYPDPVADVGSHRFTYSILPHGRLATGDEVTTAAAILNQGLTRFEGYAATAKSILPVAFEGDGVELAVLKKHEYSDDLVVRLVERRGNYAHGTLRVTADGLTATPCLATEAKDVGEALPLPLELNFKPFEIKTFRISAN